MKFYLDENLPMVLAVLLRALGFDTVSALEAENRGLTDEAQLGFAIAQARCIVTKDAGDFPRLALSLDADGVRHFGILVLSKSVDVTPTNYTGIARALTRYADLFPEGMQHTDWIHLPR
ncbi:MAG: DUF5615 family PIN-like protein [Dehalococcoidia bacterium]